jgi:hypothetical protein
MSAEAIVESLLQHASITNLVGANIALKQLPDESMPALVYNIITEVPKPNLGQSSLLQSRIQFNPLAVTIDEVIAIHAALKALCDFKHAQVIAGFNVVSMRRDTVGIYDKDLSLGVWTRPVDYMLMHYEA